MWWKRRARPGGKLDTDRFYIYYGLGTQEALARLSGEPLLVLELRQWRPEALAILRSRGSSIYGYLPVMESPAWHEERIRQLEDQDYLTRDGSRIRFEQWDSWLMDLRAASYRRVLYHELDEMFRGYPIDGIFLDTVGDIEEYAPEETKAPLSQAYRSFLSVARSRYPGTRWIQNRGFAQMAACVNLLDGYLWEDWRAEWGEMAITRREIERLRQWNAENGLGLLAVSSSDSEAALKSARRLGFLYRVMDAGYDRLP